LPCALLQRRVSPTPTRRSLPHVDRRDHHPQDLPCLVGRTRRPSPRFRDRHQAPKNDLWIDQAAYLRLTIWEDFLDAPSKTRLQDE
jgi:hypothetical protein